MIELPVASVSILPSFAAPYSMKQGDTLTFQASVFAANGATLTGRQISWVTTNGKVVSLTAAANSPPAP